MEGPQRPIMMTDGVSGMGEEEEGGDDGIRMGYLHHRETHKTVYGFKMVRNALNTVSCQKTRNKSIQSPLRITSCLD